MKLNYSFTKNHLHPYTEIDDPDRMLEGVFNHRITDASDWTDIISDIEFVMSMPNNYFYNENGSFYSGKFNIEQRNTDYHLVASYDADNVITPTTVESNKSFTKIIRKRGNVSIQVEVPTNQLLILIIAWRDFLLSVDIERYGEINLDLFTQKA